MSFYSWHRHRNTDNVFHKTTGIAEAATTLCGKDVPSLRYVRDTPVVLDANGFPFCAACLALDETTRTSPPGNVDTSPRIAHSPDSPESVPGR